MRTYSKTTPRRSWCATSAIAIATVLSFSASSASAKACTMVTPATDVLLAKMAAKVTKQGWRSLTCNLSVDDECSPEWAQGFIRLVDQDPWYETVENVIAGGNLRITAQGQAFEKLGGCSSVTIPLPRALAQAVSKDPELLNTLAGALPGASVTKAESPGKSPRSGPAIQLKNPEALKSLYQSIVKGGALPMGVSTKDVEFIKR